MARKKATKKVEKIKEEVIDEDLIDLDDFEDEDLDEEFVDEEEFEKKPKKVKVKKEEPEEPLTLEDRVIKMEQKLNILMVLAVIMTVIAIATMFIVIFKGDSKSKDNSEGTKNEETEEVVTYDYDVSAFKEISASEIESESKGKTILLYIGRSTCGYCIQFVPILTEVQEKHDYTTYYLDIAKIYDYQNGVVLDSAAEKIMLDLKTSDSQKGIMSNFGYTPMTLVIKNGKVVDSIVGYVDAGTVETLVSSNGLK